MIPKISPITIQNWIKKHFHHPRSTLLKKSDANEKIVLFSILILGCSNGVFRFSHCWSTHFKINIIEKYLMNFLTLEVGNSETVERNWLFWRCEKSAISCLPCRLFSINAVSRSPLYAVHAGFPNSKVKNLYYRLKSHETDSDHLHCYVKWRESESWGRNNFTIDLWTQNFRVHRNSLLW